MLSGTNDVTAWIRHNYIEQSIHKCHQITVAVPMEKNTVCLLKVVLNELNCLVTVNLFLQELIRTRPASDESDLGGLRAAP